MNPFTKLKVWLSLKKAKTEEAKHVPTNHEIIQEQKEFIDEAKTLKSAVTKPSKQEKAKQSKDL